LATPPLFYYVGNHIHQNPGIRDSVNFCVCVRVGGGQGQGLSQKTNNIMIVVVTDTTVDTHFVKSVVE
jgi:hypothetical protein